MEINDLTIRPFREGDYPAVAAFFEQMGPESRGFFNRNGGNSSHTLGSFEGKGMPYSIYWGAFDDEGNMAGYVFLWDMNTGVPWLGIAVAEQYKGLHLGRRLIKTAEEYARAEKKGGILLTTHIANIRGQGLYERCGFVRQGIHTSGEILYLLRF